MVEAEPRSPAPPDQPATIDAALDKALTKSLDEALAAAGLEVSGPQERLVVERVSRDLKVAVEQTASGSYRGPMPPPTMLRDFDEVVPGLARQIADMALAEQRHRHAWESRALWNDIFAQSADYGWDGCSPRAAPLAPST